MLAYRASPGFKYESFRSAVGMWPANIMSLKQGYSLNDHYDGCLSRESEAGQFRSSMTSNWRVCPFQFCLPSRSFLTLWLISRNVSCYYLQGEIDNVRKLLKCQWISSRGTMCDISSNSTAKLQSECSGWTKSTAIWSSTLSAAKPLER